MTDSHAPSPRAVSDRLRRLDGLPILVVGDLICDRYLHGDVERVSREAPVQIVRTSGVEVRPGGAANAAANLPPFGVKTYLAGVVGRDADAAALLKSLKKAGVAVHAVRSASRPTTAKVRVVARHQQVLRLDTETSAPLSVSEERALLGEIRRLLPRMKGVVLSDYGRGVLTDSLLRNVIAACRKRRIPVVVDPRGRDARRYAGAMSLTPNAAEAEEATGVSCAEEHGAERAARKLRETARAESVLLTLGGRGMLLSEKGKPPRRIPARAREVFDVTGAGDTVCALHGAILASGATAFEAAWTANVAAGIVVGKFGAATTSPSEVLRSLGEADGGAFRGDGKILSRAETAALCREWRAANRRIVFTNGCFDLLHPGHVAYLAEARAMGDALVVGLNSDSSVRRLKGNGRPVLPERERARMLAALACVDAVTVFSEATPVKLIRALRPGVLVKGGDYRDKPGAVSGARDVRSWGGRVAIASFKKGFSTTGLLRKLASGK